MNNNKAISGVLKGTIGLYRRNSPYGDYLTSRVESSGHARGPSGTHSAHIILSHGSSIGMDHEFMQRLAHELVSLGHDVSLFNFTYMQVAVATGRRRPPAPVAKLMGEYSAWVDLLSDNQPVWLVGKSLGGRLASMLAQKCSNTKNILGWGAIGFPFHPVKQPEKLRVAHLIDNQLPALIVQGTRDAMGSPEDIANYQLPSSIRLQWLEHMDHGLVPYSASPLTQNEAIVQSACWLSELIKTNGSAH